MIETKSQPEAVTTPKELSLRTFIHEMIAATGSERRRKMLANLMKWVEKHGYIDKKIKVHNFSPDADAGIEESTSPLSWVVAAQKVLVVGWSLGIWEDEDIPEEEREQWRSAITVDLLDNVCDTDTEKLDPKNKVTIFGGDVVTMVGKEIDGPRLELLKLSRDLEGKSEAEQKEIIEQDKKKIKEIYCDPKGFYVTYNIGIALFSSDENNDKRSIATSWDIFLRFNPLEESLVDEAYRSGIAIDVGPRVNLAEIAPAKYDRNFGIFVRNADAEEDLWKPVEIEVMKGLVLGGLLPPHLCLELLRKLDLSPVKAKGEAFDYNVLHKMDIDKQSMIEKVRPYLNKVVVKDEDGERLLVFPEDREYGMVGSTISLEEKEGIPQYAQKIFNLNLMRLAEGDPITAKVLREFLMHKLFND